MEQNMQVQVASWQRRETWLRRLYMLLLMIGLALGQALLNVLAFVQFLWLLFSGEPNRLLAAFGKSLAGWFGEAVRFQSGATEEKPFPWKSWPESQ